MNHTVEEYPGHIKQLENYITILEAEITKFENKVAQLSDRIR